MEKLVELDADRATDTIVLDTPPARDALDFLGAPRRILELLDSRAVELLSAPSGLVRSGLGLVDWGARAVLSAFDRATGINLLPDIQAFVRSFDGMYPGFAERARRARKLMSSDAAALVLVTTPEEARVEQACEFLAALRADGLAVKGVVVNRVLAPLPDEGALRSARISAPLRRKLRRNLREFAALKERESQNLARLRAALPAPARLAVAPDLGREPRTLQELAELARRVREA
jgi:anion-transporting  ArsA/GET3 family ATPase